MTISIKQTTADGLSSIGIGEFYTENTPEQMAWVVLILKELKDDPKWFPHGKWSTIQYIEHELGKCAKSAAESFNG